MIESRPEGVRIGPAVAGSVAGRLFALGLLVALAAGPSVAQTPNQGLVVRDGTPGGGAFEGVPRGVDPQGFAADYLIGPELGRQEGGNLFHSFARFGIGAGETATFTGPDPIEGPQSVENVISRVTGKVRSEIDGTLRSTIPGADLYLINPSWIAFGPGATLDVPGSFHAATADSVELGATARLGGAVARSAHPLAARVTGPKGRGRV